jgi:endonuclease/exonuclease/phosphatase family metal-dependent hydrolase
MKCNAIFSLKYWFVALFLFSYFASSSLQSQDQLTITTWNIEHLGSSGRGFGGGFGQGNLPKRTNEQLKQIAAFIQDDLKSDILALQEIAITRVERGISLSDQLDVITAELGGSWQYYLPPVESIPPDRENLFCAMMWNAEKVNLLNIFSMDLPNHEHAGANLFNRQPVICYFEALKDGAGTNDFVLINVHLKSGQDHDENHLIAMTIIEFNITKTLTSNEIKESDRIILGDFNDNPYAKRASGERKYSNALYEHMQHKTYVDFVTEDFHATRMDINLTSIIDHILVNKSAKRHILMDKANIFLPGNGDSSTFPEWRRTFSDHFPVSFGVKKETQDDDVDFEF